MYTSMGSIVQPSARISPHTPLEIMVLEHKCPPMVSLWLLHAACQCWPWIMIASTAGWICTRLHPHRLEKNIDSKEQSRCPGSNRGPCAVGSIARFFTSHPTVAGCGLDFIARERLASDPLSKDLACHSTQHPNCTASSCGSGSCLIPSLPVFLILGR